MEIRYTDKLPGKEELMELYEAMDWNNILQLDANQLITAMKQSWYSIYVYTDNKLIGTGRVISDGVTNAFLCGLGVHPDYRNKGIGREISHILIEQCKKANLHIQFFCKDGLVSYYEAMGFTPFAVGMKAKD